MVPGSGPSRRDKLPSDANAWYERLLGADSEEVLCRLLIQEVIVHKGTAILQH